MIKYWPELIQGEQAWLDARCGMLTASEMKLIITPTLKIANNDKEKTHLYELLAQRITGYVEPSYISDDMLRGVDDEIDALTLYEKTYASVARMGFITNDKFGFTIGYSPDGLVGEDGLIECKSRKQKLQIQTFVEYVSRDCIAPEFMIQVQTGLLVSERQWCDLTSYCGGLPMATVRVLPDPAIQDAIITAATAFEERMKVAAGKFYYVIASTPRVIPTVRKVYEEMV